MSTVLVVDDDVDLRETLCDALEMAGHRTVPARHGEEALAILRSGRAVDLLILDLMMPVMTGWQLRERMLADPVLARIPVIVMTAAADLSRTPIVADAVLAKPIALAKILAAIANVAARPG